MTTTSRLAKLAARTEIAFEAFRAQHGTRTTRVTVHVSDRDLEALRQTLDRLRRPVTRRPFPRRACVRCERVLAFSMRGVWRHRCQGRFEAMRMEATA